MLRTSKLHEEYTQLRMDLQGELDTVEDAMIRPAMTAKGHLEPMKKTIKKREDRKVHPIPHPSSCLDMRIDG